MADEVRDAARRDGALQGAVVADAVALPVEFGNASTLDTHGTGWIIGYSPWTISGDHALRHMPGERSARGVSVKWFDHPAGDPAGPRKPISIGRSMSILVGPESEFRLEFSRFEDFPAAATIAHTLRRTGDFVIWGDGVYHRAFGIRPASIMTVRWEPVAAPATAD